MNEVQIEKNFEKCGAILKGHFVLACGRHTGVYIDKFRIFDEEAVVSAICEQIAEELCSRFSDYSGNRIEAVVGPERGGKILARRIAFFLRRFYRGQPVSARFTKKDKKGDQILAERQMKDIRGKKVLIVDDVLTTGGTLKQVIDEVRKAEGMILGIAVVCKRSKESLPEINGVPLVLVQFELEMEDWPEEECPLCAKNIPVNQEFGRGRKFVLKKSVI